MLKRLLVTPRYVKELELERTIFRKNENLKFGKVMLSMSFGSTSNDHNSQYRMS